MIGTKIKYDNAISKIKSNVFELEETEVEVDDVEEDTEFKEYNTCDIKNIEEVEFINFKVDKGILYRLIFTSMIIGMFLGIIVTTMFFSFKIIKIKESHLDTKLQAMNIIDYQKERINDIENANNILVNHTNSILEEQDEQNRELELLRKRKELYDKYEYILIDSNNNRTDLTYNELQFGIDQMNKRNINPHLLFGVVHLESKGKRNASNSTSSARGYCQFIKGTAKWIYEVKLNKGTYNHDKAFDGYINLEMGAEYIAYLMNKNNGSILNTLLDYNGRELGARYYNIVNNTLSRYTDTNLNKIEQEYKTAKL